jgi:hypothetical protein
LPCDDEFDKSVVVGKGGMRLDRSVEVFNVAVADVAWPEVPVMGGSDSDIIEVDGEVVVAWDVVVELNENP